MTLLLRVLWHLTCAWWWSLAINHVDPAHRDLVHLCQRRARHAQRVRQFLDTGGLT